MAIEKNTPARPFLYRITCMDGNTRRRVLSSHHSVTAALTAGRKWYRQGYPLPTIEALMPDGTWEHMRYVEG